MLELSAWERQFVDALRREIAARTARPVSTYRLQLDRQANMLRHALRATIACFGVYRTYQRPQEISDRDRRFVVRAVAQAKRRNPDLPGGTLDIVRDVLLFEQPAPLEADGCRDRELFVGRFQPGTTNGSDGREHGVVAFDAGHQTTIVIVPRLLARLARTLEDPSDRTSVPLSAAAWDDTRVELPLPAPQTLLNPFTGQSFAADSGAILAANFYSEFPVALLTSSNLRSTD